ncbi:MAG: PilN domain-containing protein [Burkholderiales bacterium]
MVDLIPQDYRRALRLRRWLRAFCWACAGVALLTGVARLGLAQRVRAEQAGLAAVRKLEAASGAHRAKLADLQARRDAAEQQTKALESLRGPAVIAELFFAIDAAISGKVWFSELSFARGEDLAAAKPQARTAGTIIPVPPPAGAAARVWQRGQIHGEALDHSTLAEFISRLGSQPGIGQVRLINTSARNYTGMQVVDFQLTALVGPLPGAAR